MQIVRLFITLTILMISLSAHSQFKKEKRQQKTQENIDDVVQKEMEKLYGKQAELSPEYREAEALVQQAIDALQRGEVNSADALINKSIELYPTRTVFNYVREVCKMPDVNKAISIMEKLYERVKAFPEAKIIMLEPFPATYEKGKMIQGIKLFAKERALFNFGNEAYYLNKEFGGIKWAIKILQNLSEINITEKTSKTDFDYEYFMQQHYRVDLATMLKEYDKAIELVQKRPVTTRSPQSAKDAALISIYWFKEDYPKVLELSEKFKGELSEYTWKFNTYALMGNSRGALENYEKYKKSGYFMSSNGTFYTLALIDLINKDFSGALINLDSALNYRTSGTLATVAQAFLVERWKIYKSFGDTYAGLQQYEKARDNYNIALLSNPDYEPAVTALTNLETTIAKQTSSDKTAPVISLLEPAPRRGFKVTTAGANVLIKGIATDPSGLKEVKINNKIVYAQKDGDFWGEIPLAEGLNKVTVVATDFAGNKGEQVFEIERQAAKANTEIIPVVEKEGRNYCLLIAAQNYSDNNIPSLTNPVADAVKLKLIFKNNYNFAEENIITLFNPELNDVKRQLLELTNVLQPEDNLVIFYAGHGIWVEKEKKGYWLLTDAKRNDANTWLPNKTVLDLIAKVPSRHTLLITDACFSGSVFKTRGLGKDAPAAMKEMDEKISRVAITSGNDTEVPDESVFMKYLIKALSENKEKFLTAQKMFINQIIEAVMTETKTEPRYGTLELAGHVGGDYIFSKK